MCVVRAESKEDQHSTASHGNGVKKESNCNQDYNVKAEAAWKTELGKRPATETESSSLPVHSPVKKSSLFTQLDAEGTADSGQEFDLTNTGADASSAINLTMSAGSPHAKVVSSATSASHNASNTKKTPRAASITSKNTTAQAKPKSSTVAKKTQASPGMKPITSFFARSPNK